MPRTYETHWTSTNGHIIMDGFEVYDEATGERVMHGCFTGGNAPDPALGDPPPRDGARGPRRAEVLSRADALLVDVLPVRATEQAAQSSRERRSFVVSYVGFDDRRTDGGGQRRGFAVGDCAANRGSGDDGDLVPIDETQSVSRLHRDSVEEIQLGDLKDVMDLAELRPGGRYNGRADGQPLIGNRASLSTGVASHSSGRIQSRC